MKIATIFPSKEEAQIQPELPLGDRPVQIESIIPRAVQPPSPEEQREFETPLQRARRIMERNFYD